MLRRKNQRARFEEAALCHIEALYRFAAYLCQNEADAEDLVQDTYLKAFRKFHQFRPGTNLKAWLFRIVRNAHIDRTRQKKREPDLAELSEIVPARDGSSDTPAGGFERWTGLAIENERGFYDHFGDEVNRFLRELPARFRAALILCDIEGLSYQEISQVLECPVGTVRSRISRARRHLREKLYRYAQDLGYVNEGNI